MISKISPDFREIFDVTAKLMQCSILVKTFKGASKNYERSEKGAVQKRTKMY